MDNSLAGNNPLASLLQKNDRAKSNDLLANADLDYKVHFFPDLHAHLTLAMERAYGKQTTVIPVDAIGNLFYGSTGYEKKYKTNKMLTYYMQYIKELGKQKFDVMGGYEWQHFYNDGNNAYDGIVKSVPGFDDSGNATTYASTPTSDKWASESFLVSFFGRLNYTLADKYLITATIRNDGSSRFAKDNRWAFVPISRFCLEN